MSPDLRMLLAVIVSVHIYGCTATTRSIGEMPDVYAVAVDFIVTHPSVRTFIDSDQFTYHVSPEIVFLDYEAFADELAWNAESHETGNITSDLRMLEHISDSLRSIDDARRFHRIIMPSVSRLSSDLDSDTILFLSRPYHNTLAAEVIVAYQPGREYQRVSSYNTGLRFLVEYDDRGNILRSYEAVVSYD